MAAILEFQSEQPYSPYLAAQALKKIEQEAHGPQRSPELTAVSQSGHLLIIPYQPVKFQGNGLNSSWDILLTRLKCWNFQRAISKKNR